LFNGVPDPRGNGLILDGSTITVSGVAGGQSGFYALYAWVGTLSSIYANATLKAKSAEVSVIFGGGASMVPAPNVDGFSSFALLGGTLCPEPSVIALGIFGLGGVVAARRRRKA